MQPSPFFPEFSLFCESISTEFDFIPQDRKAKLEQLSSYFLAALEAGIPVQTTVICTHNSRRSHIGQILLKAAALWYKRVTMDTFSGGTEATAFNQNAINALKQVGIQIVETTPGSNPEYTVFLGQALPPMTMFSKKFDHQDNPRSGFAAIMVCTDADEACPFVPGANARFSLPYEDPKRSDGSGKEAIEYGKTVRHIGREMFYAMSRV